MTDDRADATDGGGIDRLPPTRWPDRGGPRKADDHDPGTQRVADVETPPVWAEALRFQLLGLLILALAAAVALGTRGIVSWVAEIVVVLGFAIGVMGFYAWPRSASNVS